MEYFPLKVGTVQGRLELSGNELGLFPYELNLKAVAASNERELQMRASLGTTHTITAHFVSYAKTRVDYACKVRRPPAMSRRFHSYQRTLPYSSQVVDDKMSARYIYKRCANV